MTSEKNSWFPGINRCCVLCFDVYFRWSILPIVTMRFDVLCSSHGKVSDNLVRVRAWRVGIKWHQIRKLGLWEPGEALRLKFLKTHLANKYSLSTHSRLNDVKRHEMLSQQNRQEISPNGSREASDSSVVILVRELSASSRLLCQPSQVSGGGGWCPQCLLLGLSLSEASEGHAFLGSPLCFSVSLN